MRCLQAPYHAALWGGFRLPILCVLQFVGVGLGTCSRHSLHHIGYTGKNTPRIVDSQELPFLGMNVIRNGCRLDTTVYRKPTDTGLLLHFHSHVDARYKRSLLNTMLNRAFKLSSTWKFFHKECERLKEIFSRLRYPDDLVQSIIRQFIESKVSEDSLACVQTITKLWLVPSAKQRRDPCSGPPTDSTNYRKCVSNSPST